MRFSVIQLPTLFSFAADLFRFLLAGEILSLALTFILDLRNSSLNFRSGLNIHFLYDIFEDLLILQWNMLVKRFKWQSFDAIMAVAAVLAERTNINILFYDHGKDKNYTYFSSYRIKIDILEKDMFRIRSWPVSPVFGSKDTLTNILYFKNLKKSQQSKGGTISKKHIFGFSVFLIFGLRICRIATIN